MSESKTVEQEIMELEIKLAALRVKQAEQEEMVQKAASIKVAALVEEAQKLLAEAEKIATEAGIGFAWDGPGYGMGGWFESGEWNASSQSC